MNPSLRLRYVPHTFVCLKGLTASIQADEMLEKIYSNMSACHIKNSNWKRAVETADKVNPLEWRTRVYIRLIPIMTQALKKNEKNSKALLRKAKGLGEQGYFEKAEKILNDLLASDPDSECIVLARSYPWFIESFTIDKAAVEAELTKLRAADKERERVHNQKFKGIYLPINLGSS